VGGVVMGFAAKDMLSNIFGGLLLQMDRPFSVGDWIRSDKFEGIVEKISLAAKPITTPPTPPKVSKLEIEKPKCCAMPSAIETIISILTKRVTILIESVGCCCKWTGLFQLEIGFVLTNSKVLLKKSAGE
jgi:hypothetical protein